MPQQLHSGLLLQDPVTHPPQILIGHLSAKAIIFPCLSSLGRMWVAPPTARLGARPRAVEVIQLTWYILESRAPRSFGIDGL